MTFWLRHHRGNCCATLGIVQVTGTLNHRSASYARMANGEVSGIWPGLRIEARYTKLTCENKHRRSTPNEA
eukprot:119917-Pyramimonas_sp.AAC.2